MSVTLLSTTNLLFVDSYAATTKSTDALGSTKRTLTSLLISLPSWPALIVNVYKPSGDPLSIIWLTWAIADVDELALACNVDVVAVSLSSMTNVSAVVPVIAWDVNAVIALELTTLLPVVAVLFSVKTPDNTEVIVEPASIGPFNPTENELSKFSTIGNPNAWKMNSKLKVLVAPGVAGLNVVNGFVTS